MLKWCEIAMFPWPVFIPLDISYNLQSVGQMLGGAVEPGCHYPYDAESGVNSTEEEEKLLTKLEIDTGAGKGTSIPKTTTTTKNLQKSSAKVSPVSISHLFILVPPLPGLFSFQLMNVMARGAERPQGEFSSW